MKLKKRTNAKSALLDPVILIMTTVANLTLQTVMATNTESISKLYCNCHVKTISFMNAEDNQPFSKPDSSNEILEAVKLFSTQSLTLIEVIWFKINVSVFTSNLTGEVSILPLKYTSCFVHSYVLPEILAGDDQNMKIKDVLELAMYYIRKRGEWPNHSIFLVHTTQDEIELISFYKEWLPYTFARGVLLSVNLSNKRICEICMLCDAHNILQNVQSEQIQSLENMESRSRRINLNMNGGLVSASFSMYKMYPEPYKSVIFKFCEFMSKRRPIITSSWYTACIYSILPEWFNCTQSFDEKNSMFTFAILHDTNFITKSNQYYHKVRADREWLPYLDRTFSFHFIAFQKCPYVSDGLLAKPHKIFTWVLFLISGIGLTVITLFFKSILSEEESPFILERIFRLITSVAAPMFDQQIGIILRQRTVYDSQVLPVCWLLWSLSIIVLNTAYKTMLFACLTKGSRPIWPTSLKELAYDPSYHIMTTDTISQMDCSSGKWKMLSGVRNVMFGNLENSEPGIDYPVEYLTLNKSLQYYNSKEIDIEQQIIQANSDEENVKNGYKVGKAKYPKFAFINKDAIPSAMYFSIFVKDLVISHPTKIPGHLVMIPFLVMRNFLHERFLTAMGHLQATGFFVATFKYCMKWSICRPLTNYKRYFNLTTTTKKLNVMQWCLNIASDGVPIKSIQFEKDVGTNKFIGIEQIGSLLKVCGITYFVAFSVLIMELIRENLKRFWPSSDNVVILVRSVEEFNE